MVFDDQDGVDRLDTVELIEDLSLSQPGQVNRVRRKQAHPVSLAVTIEPGNASEKGRFKSTGTSLETSNTGISVILDMAFLPGDVHKLSFPQADQPLPRTFALCNKCQLLSNGQFQVSFDFFKPLNLQGNTNNQGGKFSSHPEA